MVVVVVVVTCLQHSPMVLFGTLFDLVSSKSDKDSEERTKDRRGWEYARTKGRIAAHNAKSLIPPIFFERIIIN